MKQSPMLQHAIESFAHGLEHFLDGTERSRKFALLHIDQSVELFLKEKCIRLGKSIYKSDGTTLTVHETFRSLEKEIELPERPRLEELHDLRNTVQHKGLTPDAGTTDFYIHVGYDFAKRFLEKELSLPIADVLSRQHRALMEGPEPSQAAPEFERVLTTASTAATPAATITAAYTVLSRAAQLLGDPKAQRIRFRQTLRDAAVGRGVEKGEIDRALETILVLRGKALHEGYEPSKSEAAMYLRTVVAVLEMVGYPVSDSFAKEFRAG